MKSKKELPLVIFFGAFLLFLFVGLVGSLGELNEKTKRNDHRLKILSSSENQDLETVLNSYAAKHSISLDITYAGTLEIMDIMNGKNDYDAIWTSNSIWLYMLDNKSIIEDAVSTSINPILFGIKKKKAVELGFVGKDVTMHDILNAIKEGKLKFLMPSATQTNTGASAYLGFLATLSGNKEVLGKEDLENEGLRNDMIELLKGVERSSGSDEFLSDLIKKDEFDALVSYESSLIQLNQELESNGKEPLYFIYPVDGVTLSDSPLAFVNHNNKEKKEAFLALQKEILSENGQNDLARTGRRTWYGGVKSDTDPKVFNKDWGVDTEKYLSPIKYPSTEVIRLALLMYQEELRKPIHTVFALDYSGSMYGSGMKELLNAMDYILDYEKSSTDMVQFSRKDKITILPFNQDVITTIHTDNGLETNSLWQQINEITPGGQTNLYDTILKGVEILESETSDYNTSIVLMTDGEGNVGSYKNLSLKYESLQKEIPVYGILFGSASESQLSRIATLTKGKVFDGKTDLRLAFKTVRGYN